MFHVLKSNFMVQNIGIGFKKKMKIKEKLNSLNDITTEQDYMLSYEPGICNRNDKESIFRDIQIL